MRDDDPHDHTVADPDWEAVVHALAYTHRPYPPENTVLLDSDVAMYPDTDMTCMLRMDCTWGSQVLGASGAFHLDA